MDPFSPFALTLLLAMPVHPSIGTIDYLDPGGAYPGPLALVPGATPADDVVWIAHRNIDGPTRLSRLRLAPGATAERLAELPDSIAGRSLAISPRPTALVVDPTGAWLATEAGLYRWEPIPAPGAASPQTTLTRHGSDAAVSHLVATPDGLLFAVAAVPGVGVSAAPVTAFDAPNPLAGRATLPRADAAVAVGPGRIWVGGPGGLLEAAPRGAFRIDLTGTPLATIPPDRFAIQAMAVAARHIWIAADRLYRVSGDHYQPVARSAASLLPDGADGLIVASWAPTAVERFTAGAPSDPPPARLWPLDAAPTQATLLAAGPEGVWLEEQPRIGAPYRVVRIAAPGPAGAITLWPLARPAETYLSPGIVAAIRDGRGGLLIATNDGLWHLR